MHAAVIAPGECLRSAASLGADASAIRTVWRPLLAAGVKSTLVAGENLTVGSTVWLPAEGLAPGR